MAAMNSHKKIHTKGEFHCAACERHFKTQAALQAHRAKCKKWSEMMNEILSPAFLVEHLVEKGETANYIAEVVLKDAPLRVYAGGVIEHAKRLGIHTKSYSESAHSSMKQRNTTNLQKYGQENVLGYGTEVYEKRNKTIQERYQVSCVFKLEDVKRKSKSTMLERYGVENPINIPNRISNVGRRSKAHQIVEEWLQSAGIEFESEKVDKALRAYNKDLQRWYQPRPDITLNKNKIIIEIYGDRWHANPAKYKDSDQIVLWTGLTPVAEIHRKNKIREQHLKDLGYLVICIWTSSIGKGRGAQAHTRIDLLKEIEKCQALLQSNPSSEYLQKTDTIYL
jgi:G:T-mismatch repair DNA endonuclease (very short patch repair protein)